MKTIGQMGLIGVVGLMLAGCDEKRPTANATAEMKDDTLARIEALAVKTAADDAELARNMQKLSTINELNILMNQWTILEANSKELVRRFDDLKSAGQRESTKAELENADAAMKALTAEMKAAAETMQQNAARRSELKKSLGIE